MECTKLANNTKKTRKVAIFSKNWYFYCCVLSRADGQSPEVTERQEQRKEMCILPRSVPPGRNDGKKLQLWQSTGEALVLYINKIRMSVCLSVCLFVRYLLLGKFINIEVLYMDRRRILLGRFLSIFRIRPATWSEVIVRKPDTGRKNGRKNPVFWRFYE